MQCNALKATLGSKAADSLIKKRIISTKGMVVLPLIMVMILKSEEDDSDDVAVRVWS